MRRLLITIISVSVLLLITMSAFGQRPERSTRPPAVGADESRMPRELSEEERERLRQRFQNMTEEEREQFRARMRESFGPRRGTFLSRQEQLEAIDQIQAQLAKLRKTVEDVNVDDSRRMRDLSEEERSKLRETLEKVFEERENSLKAIVAQIAKLQGQRQPTEDEQYLIVNTGDLRRIQDIADDEHAEETARNVERLIRGRQRPGGDRMPRPDQRRPEFMGDRPPQPGARMEPEPSGPRAPQFTLSSFNGKQVSLSDFTGKIVVLEWLNTECPFVRYHYDTAKTMVDLANKYKDKGVVWLAINSTSHTTGEANLDFAKQHNMPYQILDDRSGKVGHEYNATNTPHIFVIDPRGNIAYAGAIDNAPMGKAPEGQTKIDYVDNALSEMIAGKNVSVHLAKPYGCTVKYAN